MNPVNQFVEFLQLDPNDEVIPGIYWYDGSGNPWVDGNGDYWTVS